MTKQAQIQASHNPKVSQGHFGNIKGDLTYQSKFSRANARQASKKPTRKARKPFARVAIKPATSFCKSARKPASKSSPQSHSQTNSYKTRLWRQR